MENGAHFVDLHSHVLPGIDDGATDEGEALAMLRIAAEEGTTRIAATPHDGQSEPEQIEMAVAALNASAARAGLSVAVVTGSEVMFAADLAERYRAGRLLALNHTRYILMEVPFDADWPPFFARAVFDLRIAGATPILAHAERYRAVQRNPLILADVIAGGVLIQVNAASLVGTLGATVRKTAETLLARRMVHVIASDAHNATTRPPRIRAALDRIGASVDADYAAWLRSAAIAVLEDVTIDIPEPNCSPRRSLLGRLRSR